MANIKYLFETCKILQMNDFQVYQALKNQTPDFEDALQIACADLEVCDFIITNNKKHFEGFTYIPVFTPDEFIERVQTS